MRIASGVILIFQRKGFDYLSESDVNIVHNPTAKPTPATIGKMGTLATAATTPDAPAITPAVIVGARILVEISAILRPSSFLLISFPRM